MRDKDRLVRSSALLLHRAPDPPSSFSPRVKQHRQIGDTDLRFQAGSLGTLSPGSFYPCDNILEGIGHGDIVAGEGFLSLAYSVLGGLAVIRQQVRRLAISLIGGGQFALHMLADQ